MSLRFVRPLISRQLWHGIWYEERIWGFCRREPWGQGWCLVRCFDAIFVATRSIGHFSVWVEISLFGWKSEAFVFREMGYCFSNSRESDGLSVYGVIWNYAIGLYLTVWSYYCLSAAAMFGPLDENPTLDETIIMVPLHQSFSWVVPSCCAPFWSYLFNQDFIQHLLWCPDGLPWNRDLYVHL